MFSVFQNKYTHILPVKNDETHRRKGQHHTCKLMSAPYRAPSLYKVQTHLIERVDSLMLMSHNVNVTQHRVDMLYKTQ